MNVKNVRWSWFLSIIERKTNRLLPCWEKQIGAKSIVIKAYAYRKNLSNWYQWNIFRLLFDDFLYSFVSHLSMTRELSKTCYMLSAITNNVFVWITRPYYWYHMVCLHYEEKKLCLGGMKKRLCCSLRFWNDAKIDLPKIMMKFEILKHSKPKTKLNLFR